MSDDASQKTERQPKPEIENDTAEVVYLMDDSLVLRFGNRLQSYYRISNADDANKLAREKAEKNAREAISKVTDESAKAPDVEKK